MYEKCNAIIRCGASAMDDIRKNKPIYCPEIEPVGTAMVVELAKTFDCKVTERAAQFRFKKAYSVLAREAFKTSVKGIWALPKIHPRVNVPRSDDIGWFMATHFYGMWNDGKEEEK